MNLLITICGRAGSKGVKSKNFRLFMGNPLIYYTLKIAKKYKAYKMGICNVDISVSSDSDEILEYASQFKDVQVIKRPDELATDLAPKVPVIQHATKTMESIKGIKYDFILDLDITSPLRKIDNIDRALNKCSDSENNYDLVFSAVKSRRNPYFHSLS